MVLEEIKNANHNVMLHRRTQRKIPQDFKDKLLPPSKRLKTAESIDGDDLSSRCPSDEDESLPLSPRSRSPIQFRSTEIPDSEDEGEDEADQIVAPRVTELESALPPVVINKTAIAEYEAMRAENENLPDDLKARLTGRTWERGKSSIYSDAFNLALETVLEDEGHLFDEKEMEVFKQWRELDYEAQYLYVRLFLRKTSAWHRITRLGYHGDLTDVSAASKVLQSTRVLPESTATIQANPAELGPPEGTVLEDLLTFADSSEDQIKTLDEALSLLNLDELKGLAKELKVQGKNKADILKALRETSQRQAGLGYVGLKRADSALKSNPTTPDGSILEEKEEDDSLDHMNRDAHFLRKIMAITGPCIRLSLPALNLFERVHLVFYRSTEWTDKSLTTIILARISRRNFPSYIVSRSTNIFPTRSTLLEFEASIRTQYRVDNILDGHPGKSDLDQVLETFEAIYPRWKILLAEEQRKEDSIYESGEGGYLRRFSPAWVYTRIVHKALYVIGRFKSYEKEYSLLTELLSQKLFHSARRGAWYQRKALLEEHYMYTLLPTPGIKDPEQQKRQWKRISLKTCEQGLQDRYCHTIYHYDLQKRIRKLEKTLKIPKREKHDFEHVLLSKPIETIIQGIQIKKSYLTPTTLRRKSSAPNGFEERQRSTKTIWLDEYESPSNPSECSVEQLSLSYYRSLGFRGYHSEGGILRTLFAYLFFDILFLYIPNVFQTEYQTCPLDLHTESFYEARASEINHRIVEIENGMAPGIIREVWEREGERKTCVVGLRWDFERQDLEGIVEAFGSALGKVMRVMAEEYRVRGGGVPDLFLWDDGVEHEVEDEPMKQDPVKRELKEEKDIKTAILEDVEEEKKELQVKNESQNGSQDTIKRRRKKEVLFVEVKSENDRLSDTQRMWIHVLLGAGIRVELCNVVAREVKVIDAE
ncbi:putative coiled-coil domain-containing protein mtmr15 protein [Botrytis fragariae]|uniref:Fanconi-associated nuclease n=1 Tax=Botrytis fragariae TaxID=1964551 RepID=A0A8H6EKB9_9HELO|nr:putative coiled-coil domain-containing protein mtmr15 protein [Botrytis fragariae]KAF5875416.1 putative coiled-coil domain-containing protein mtmr15 protein [Botrytis fragariae]